MAYTVKIIDGEVSTVGATVSAYLNGIAPTHLFVDWEILGTTGLMRCIVTHD